MYIIYNIRSYNSMRKMIKLVVIFCVLGDNQVYSNNSSRCLACINCLLKKDDKNLDDTKSAPSTQPHTLTKIFEKNRCPSDDSLEYSYLQQIEYLYRGKHIREQAPCYSECTECRKRVLKRCKQLNKLSKNAWEVAFEGIFTRDVDSYIDSSEEEDESDEIIYSASTVSVTTTAEKPRRKRTATHRQTQALNGELDLGCGTENSLQPFIDKLTDNDEIMWHAVWFNETSLNCQFYEEISCRSLSCSRVDTVRSFLMTTEEPHYTYGHTFTLFSNFFVKDIRFQNFYFGGYCIKQAN